MKDGLCVYVCTMHVVLGTVTCGHAREGVASAVRKTRPDVQGVKINCSSFLALCERAGKIGVGWVM